MLQVTSKNMNYDTLLLHLAARYLSVLANITLCCTNAGENEVERNKKTEIRVAICSSANFTLCCMKRGKNEVERTPKAEIRNAGSGQNMQSHSLIQ